jgi:hypothetical protein
MSIVQHNFKMCVFAIGLIAAIDCISLHAQSDSNATTLSHNQNSNWQFSPRFRGTQGELVFVLFSSSYGGSVDVDLLRDVSTRRAGIGIRIGFERIEKSDLGGKTTGSPFLHYNLLTRFTFPMGNSWRTDFYAGATRHVPAVSGLSQIYASLFPAKTLLKVGMDIRWRLGGEIFGLLLKWSYTKEIGNGGIGLYVGWSE